MTVIGSIILVILILFVLMAERKWAAIGVVASVIFLTHGQQIFIGGFNVFPVRFVEVAGILRIFVRREYTFSKLNAIDKSFIVFQCVYLSVYIIRSFVEPNLIETRAFRVGFFLDGIMSYFIFRVLLSDPLVFRQFLQRCAFLIIPLALFMIVEAATGKNLFYFMGGIPESPVLRGGYYRAQGPFGVAITAGSFGATLSPLFMSAIISQSGPVWGLLGIIACVAIMIASHSSGPLLAFSAGLLAWMCWVFRRRMKIVRWGIVLFLVILQLMMKAPIWFIFSRMSDYLGGDGWHRSNLIDQFIKHFKDWWLIGMPLEKTGNWAATVLDNGSVDVTNEYVSIGISAGLITLYLFIRLLTKCYKTLGKSMRSIRNDAAYMKQDELLLWGIGSSLLAHILNISAVRYWDQIFVIWYMTLAIVSSMTAYYLNNNKIVNNSGSLSKTKNIQVTIN